VAALIALGLLASIGFVAAATPTRGVLFFTLVYTLDWSAPVGMWAYLALGLGLAAVLPALPRPHPSLARLAPAGALALVTALGAGFALAGRSDTRAGLYRPLRAVVARTDAALGRAHTVRIDSSPALPVSELRNALVYQLRADGRRPVSRVLPVLLGGQYSLHGQRPDAAIFIRDASAPGPAPAGRVAARAGLPGRVGPPHQIVVTVAP
jgi:hypothetical protein